MSGRVELEARHEEPGGRRTEIALQRDWNDRRAPSTLAAGDESPMNSRERRVQRAFQGPGHPCLLSAPLPHERPGAGGTQRQEKGEILLLTGFLHTRVNKGESKADASRGDLGHIMESDIAQAYPYAGMSHKTMPTIPTRIEHWPTSLIISGHEFSSSLSLSPSSSIESISSMSTDFIYFSCVGGIGE